MRELLTVLPRVADSDVTVLVQGESGTGKELLARALHEASRRRARPFVTVNCSAMPDSLLEAELFGRRTRSGSGRGRKQIGQLGAARGGTVFLDEVADISPALQVRLLRVLQEKEYQPQGASSAVKADVRLVAATARNLDELVTEGRFRQDFLYRVNVARLCMPALRERREDIGPLCEHFLAKLNRDGGREVEGLSRAATVRLMRYDWPGNVRELASALEYAHVLCAETLIAPEHLPPELCPAEGAEAPPPGGTLAELEVWAIRRALLRSGGRKREAALELGIDPSTLWRKMKRMDLE